MNNVPTTNDMVKSSNLPFAVVLQPLAVPRPEDPPIQVRLGWAGLQEWGGVLGSVWQGTQVAGGCWRTLVCERGRQMEWGVSHMMGCFVLWGMSQVMECWLDVLRALVCQPASKHRT